MNYNIYFFYFKIFLFLIFCFCINLYFFLIFQGNLNEYKVSKVIIHPKAVTIAELFGEFDSAREWRDGILSINYKLFANGKNGNR